MVIKGQRIGRVRDAEWLLCHGKTHTGRKVGAEDQADTGGQLGTWVHADSNEGGLLVTCDHSDVRIRWLPRAICESLVLL